MNNDTNYTVVFSEQKRHIKFRSQEMLGT